MSLAKLNLPRILKYLLSAAILLSSFAACKKRTIVTYDPGIIGPAAPLWDSNAVRGVWVTTAASTALNSRTNIQDMVTNCKTAGINNIFVVVYNNARTTYPSTVMNNLIGKPILETFAGRDPLLEVIQEAHAKNIKVHAWFEYGFASSYSAAGGPIVAAKPTWAAKDASGILTVKNGFDWLNGINPEVQQYMIDLFKEVVTNYNVDGVQGDDRLPAMPSTAGYDAYTVALYKSENGGANPPASYTDAAWTTWRAKKLNAFLKRLRTEVKAIKPAVQFTMAPSVYPFSLTEYLQDWPTWVDSSWVDAILPQCYRYDIASYNSTLAQQKTYYKNTAIPFYPGVLLKSGTYTAAPAYLSQMVQSNRSSGFKGECFFFYEGLKDVPTWFTGQYPYIK
ncbi:MAG: family 10 glycosylhydrolase [Chitinophagaceae bacterium]